MTGTSPTPANTTNSIIENVLFNNLYNALVSLRPAWTEVRKCSFFNYVNVGVYLYTTSGNEAAGGSVHDNYFYTTLSSSLAAIYSEVGYLNIYNNASFGSVKSVSLNISNNAAGSIAIHDNMFENFSTTAVQVSSGDGSAAGMVSIHSNQIQSSASTATSVILVTENLTTTAWLSELLIQNNRLRCASASGSVLIWVQAATKCLVSGNIVRETGANNPFGIRVGGATTNAGLIAPIQVFDNIITGTTNPYTLNTPANVQLRDVTGNTFAAMPSAPTNGSQVFVTDGTPGSSPLTGGGTGCMAFRQNGAWRGI
jgi:hypothetical protein